MKALACSDPCSVVAFQPTPFQPALPTAIEMLCGAYPSSEMSTSMPRIMRSQVSMRSGPRSETIGSATKYSKRQQAGRHESNERQVAERRAAHQQRDDRHRDPNQRRTHVAHFHHHQEGRGRHPPMMAMRMKGEPKNRWSFGRSCSSQAIRMMPEETPSCAGWNLKPITVSR